MPRQLHKLLLQYKLHALDIQYVPRPFFKLKCFALQLEAIGYTPAIHLFLCTTLLVLAIVP